MYIVIRNYCQNLPVPNNGWNSPVKGEKCFQMTKKRIHLLRNEVYAHTASASISKCQYEKHLQILRDVCDRMDTIHSSYLINSTQLYTQELKSIETCCMDAELHGKYTSDIQRLSLQDQDRQRELEELRANTKKLESENVEMRENVTQLHRNLSEVRKKVEVKEVKAHEIQENNRDCAGSSRQS